MHSIVSIRFYSGKACLQLQENARNIPPSTGTEVEKDNLIDRTIRYNLHTTSLGTQLGFSPILPIIELKRVLNQKVQSLVNMRSHVIWMRSLFSVLFVLKTLYFFKILSYLSSLITYSSRKRIARLNNGQMNNVHLSVSKQTIKRCENERARNFQCPIEQCPIEQRAFSPMSKASQATVPEILMSERVQLSDRFVSICTASNRNVSK